MFGETGSCHRSRTSCICSWWWCRS